MITRLFTLMQLRRSTAFLLARADDRLLDDIGLTRADLAALHIGLPAARGAETAPPARLRGRIIPA